MSTIYLFLFQGNYSLVNLRAESVKLPDIAVPFKNVKATIKMYDGEPLLTTLTAYLTFASTGKSTKRFG